MSTLRYSLRKGVTLPEGFSEILGCAARPRSLAKPSLTCSTLRSAGWQALFETGAAPVASDAAGRRDGLSSSMATIRAPLAIHQVVERGTATPNPTRSLSCLQAGGLVCVVAALFKCVSLSLAEIPETRSFPSCYST
jgi:hypothetical protein